MSFINIAILVTAFTMIITGLFMLLRTYNMIRIIIAIEVIIKAVTLVLAFATYLNGNHALGQTLIITMILIEVVVAVVAAGIAVSVYRNNGNMDVRNLNKLKG
jgi:NADH:ubiquinone oxidoreductase subunit K